MNFFLFGLRSQKSAPRGAPEMFLRFEYQKPIDAMIFLPFGLRSLFGHKNRLRKGRQTCLRFEYQKLIDSMNFFVFGLRSQKSAPRGAPEMFTV